MEHLIHSIRNLAPDSPQHRESGADGASRGARVPVSQRGVHRFPVGKRDGDPSSGLDRPIESLVADGASPVPPSRSGGCDIVNQI